MAVTALIKFTQGLTIGVGEAILGVTGVVVTVENVSNVGVNSWRIELLDVPSYSALVPGVLAQASTAVPLTTFTPDVDGGSYRVRLTVWPNAGFAGTPNIDIRNVVVQDVTGYATPPAQIWPEPLPPTPSGLPGNKPDEMNISGQSRGWAGNSTDGLLDQFMKFPRQAQALRETGGPVVMTMGAVADGQVLVRSDSSIVGSNIAGGMFVAAGTQTGTGGTALFSNANGISFGMAGSTRVTASYTVPSTAGLLSAVNVSAGTTSNNLSALTFSNSNGLAFGLNASTITGSYTVPSTAGLISAVNLSAGTTSNNLTNAVFSNSNNVSFGLNGSTVTASASYSQSTAPAAISAGTEQATSGTVVFSNSNGLVFGMSANTVTGSYTVPSTAGLISAVNVSAGTTSNNLTALTFSNGSGVSFGINASTVTASVAAGATATGNLGAIAAGTQTATSGTVVLSDSNGITFGMAGSTQVTASYNFNVSAGTTSNNLNSVVFSNSNGVSFGLSGSTVTGSVPAMTLSEWDAIAPPPTAGSTLISANIGTSGSASFFPFQLPNYVAAGWGAFALSLNFQTVGALSGRQSQTLNFGIYTRGTGSNSTTISRLTSASFFLGVTGNNSSYTINQPTSTFNNGYSTADTNSAGSNITSLYAGGKYMQFPVNSTMSPGNYWLGIVVVNSTSSNNVGISVSFLGYAFNVAGLAPIGSGASAFSTGTNIPLQIGGNWFMGNGNYSSAGQTDLPSSIALSDMTQNIGNRPAFKLVTTP